MNYQKVFDTIGWTIVIVCVIAGFIIPLYLYDIAPDNKEITIQLLPGEIPSNAIRVFDVKDIETVGEVKRVFGTYDFYSCNQTYVSTSLNKQKEIVEFSIRGTTHNETFDYRFCKDIPLVLESFTIKYRTNNILLFNNENVVIEYYKDDFGLLVSIFVGVILAVILGIISYLIMCGLEIILKSNPAQEIHRRVKRFISREKKE